MAPTYQALDRDNKRLAKVAAYRVAEFLNLARNALIKS